ncbi:MAG: hypothetical protein IT303_11420 [Dehalococcoidia bacterium]|nr:hypothetical protein [Dehalococcoidia bacterium]
MRHLDIRAIRASVVVGGAAAGILAGALMAPAQSPNRGNEPTPTAVTTPSPSPTAEPATPSPTPIPTSTATPPPKELIPSGPPRLPAGPIAADPVRVATGDGDCLNVRLTPGTTFGGDPRVCVPDRTLLWLFGDPVTVDGEQWRYALGQGWVAIAYTRPDPSVVPVAPPSGEAIVLHSTSDIAMEILRVDGDGRPLRPGFELPNVQQGIGGVIPHFSPGGRWATGFNTTERGSSIVLADTISGVQQEYRDAYPLDWSAGGRLLASYGWACSGPCKPAFAIIDPATGELTTIPLPETISPQGIWDADGRTIIAVGTDYRSLYRVSPDGTASPIANAFDEGGVGQLVLGPDGRSLLMNAFLGPLRILDLETGAIRQVPRAEQIPVGGKCGGSIGNLAAWVDADTLIYHESYARKGENGITIAELSNGTRRIVPYFSVRDIRAVGPNTATFSTQEYVGDMVFEVAWLLDLRNGDARPFTSGGAVAWLP